jgi:hypothetical protein
MSEETGMTKTAIKNNRWMLLEQRMTFVEKSMDGRLCRVEDSLKDLKANELMHLSSDIGKLRCDMQTQNEKLDGKISELQKIIYKAIGAIGAVLGILQIVLKIVK